jgi:hypothetical protein
MDSRLDRSTMGSKVDQLARKRPDLVLAGPYFLYLLLLALRDTAGNEWVWLFTILRGVLPLLLLWRLRSHLPALGRGGRMGGGATLPGCGGRAAAIAFAVVSGRGGGDQSAQPVRVGAFV